MTALLRNTTLIGSVFGICLMLTSGIAQARILPERKIEGRSPQITRVDPGDSRGFSKRKAEQSSITVRPGTRVGYIQEIIVGCGISADGKTVSGIVSFSLIEKTFCTIDGDCAPSLGLAARNICSLDDNAATALKKN